MHVCLSCLCQTAKVKFTPVHVCWSVRDSAYTTTTLASWCTAWTPGSAQSVCSFHPCWPCYPPVKFPIRSCHKLPSQHSRSLPLLLRRYPSMAPWPGNCSSPFPVPPAAVHSKWTFLLLKALVRPGDSPIPPCYPQQRPINKYPGHLSCNSIFPAFFFWILIW